MKELFRQTWGDRRTFWMDLLCDLAGSALYAAGLMQFAHTAGFALGGISGVALLINHFTRLPVGLTTLVLDLPLMLFSLRVLGRSFLLKSAVSILTMTLVNDLVFARLPGYAGDPLLGALFCGALLGAGLGLIYNRGSSTGGTDFLVLPLHRITHRFTVPQLSMAMDGVILLAGALVYGALEPALYGIVASVACSVVMDRLMTGARREKMAMIITDHGMELATRIAAAIDRGSTNVKAIGTYTGRQRDLLLCVCSRRQVAALRAVVHEADPRALVMITEVSEAFGEGFQPPSRASL